MNENDRAKSGIDVRQHFWHSARGDQCWLTPDLTAVPPVRQEVQAAIDRAEDRSWPLIGVERHAFYEKAKTAYCVIATGERRFLRVLPLHQGRHSPGTARADREQERRRYNWCLRRLIDGADIGG